MHTDLHCDHVLNPHVAKQAIFKEDLVKLGTLRFDIRVNKRSR